MIPNRLCSSYFSVTVLCALSYTIKRIVVLRRPYMAASPVPGKTLKRFRQYISHAKRIAIHTKKEAVRNIIYLWQHDETAVPDSADSTAPLINSCFKSRLLRHLSTSSFQRYLIIGMPLCVCQALFYKKISALSVKHTTVCQSKDLIHRLPVFDIVINKIFRYVDIILSVKFLFTKFMYQCRNIHVFPGRRTNFHIFPVLPDFPDQSAKLFIKCYALFQFI